MASLPTKSRYVLHLVFSETINGNQRYEDLGRLLVAVAPNYTFADLLNAAKPKIEKKHSPSQSSLNYEEQTGLQIFIRPKSDEDITDMVHKWSEIIDFSEDVADYVPRPNDEVIVFLFHCNPQSASNAIPSTNFQPQEQLQCPPIPTSLPVVPDRESRVLLLNNHRDPQRAFLGVRCQYFVHSTGQMNELNREFRRDATVGDVKQQLSVISGIAARLQYKWKPNLIDADICICSQVQRVDAARALAALLPLVTSITDFGPDAQCTICLQLLGTPCTRCHVPVPPGVAPSPLPPNVVTCRCTVAGSTECSHLFHLHCISRWLRTRSSAGGQGTCPLHTDTPWKFRTDRDASSKRKLEVSSSELNDEMPPPASKRRKLNDETAQANNDKQPETEPQRIHFYYRKMEHTGYRMDLEHVEMSCTTIDAQSTVKDVCAQLQSMVEGLQFGDKKLFANAQDVTFDTRKRLHEIGSSVWHICGCNKHPHKMRVRVDHVQFLSDDGKVSSDNDDDIGMPPLLRPHAQLELPKVHTLDSCEFEAVSSGSTVKDLKQQIEEKMDIKMARQCLYRLAELGNGRKEYQLVEDDARLSEIVGVVQDLQLFVCNDSEPIHCTFDLFCNGYLLPHQENLRPFFEIFDAFQTSAQNGNDVLYVSPRWLYRKGAFIKKSVADESLLYHDASDNSTLTSALKLSPAWIPHVPQTRKGMTSFLSCLYVIAKSSVTHKNKVLGMVRGLTLNRFAPLVLSLKILLERRLLQLTQAHKAALANGFFYLFRNMVPSAVCGDDQKVFHYSHIIFSFILGHCDDERHARFEKFELRQLMDPIALTRLVDPVTINSEDEPTMTVFVKSVQSKETMKVEDIRASVTVHMLQKRVAKEHGIAVKRQTMVFGGKVLRQGVTLQACNVKDQSTLQMALSGESGGDEDGDLEILDVDIEEEDEDASAAEVVYSRHTVLDRSDGAKAGKQFAHLTEDDLIPSSEVSALLQSYAACNEVYVWNWKAVDTIDYKDAHADVSDAERDPTRSLILSRLNKSWADIVRCVGDNKQSKVMKIIPTLSIRNLNNDASALTLDCNGNLCALCGVEKGDKHTRQFFLPLYDRIYRNDLDQLANVIKELNLNIDADAWVDAQDLDTIDDRQPIEAIIVCFDRSYSMQESCFGDDNMSRLGVVKCYFDAFLNRSKAYDYANHIGLITFNSRVTTTCKLSPLYERFRNKVGEIEVCGRTALRDAMREAANQLVAWKRHDDSRKKCHLRIIALTDGEDNKSTIDSLQLTQLLLREDIVADAITIGNHNVSLHGICRATGGYVFYPQAFRDGLRIFELETFLSITARSTRDLNQRKAAHGSINYEYQLAAFAQTAVDVCNENHVPKGKVLENLQTEKATISLQSKVQKIESASSDVKQQYYKRSRARRVIREMSDILKDPHPFWDVYVEDENIFFWKLVLEGPAETPYENGTFLLYMEFGKDYPDKAPSMRFITPIKHVNVNSYGRICHSIFDRNYNPDTKVRDFLNNVYGLLLDPDWDDPLDSVLRQEYADSQDLFRSSVASHVSSVACKNRAQFKKELGADDQSQSGNNNCDSEGWIPHNNDDQTASDIV